MTLNVVKLPSHDVGDIPRGLRALADQIESGEFGEPVAMAWALDCCNGRLEVGLLGSTAEPLAVAHFMHAMAQAKLVVND